MDWLFLTNGLAAALTIAGALLVASNYSAKVMVAGFIIYAFASLVWMMAGWLDHKTSLIIQNAVLLGVSLFGIVRWIPKA